jgi:hypothetical protein
LLSVKPQPESLILSRVSHSYVHTVHTVYSSRSFTFIHSKSYFPTITTRFNILIYLCTKCLFNHVVDEVGAGSGAGRSASSGRVVSVSLALDSHDNVSSLAVNGRGLDVEVRDSLAISVGSGGSSVVEIKLSNDTSDGSHRSSPFAVSDSAGNKNALLDTVS